MHHDCWFLLSWTLLSLIDSMSIKAMPNEFVSCDYKPVDLGEGGI